jgi:cell shape-determining protein MreD
MSTWEQILLVAGAMLVAVIFWPGIKATLERSRQAPERDWASALVPIVLVILFVILLIAVARH